MSKLYRVADAAVRDLKSLWNETARTRGAGVADAMVDEIIAAIRSVPCDSGTPCDELSFGVCGLPVGDQVVYYRPKMKGGVMVARVLQRIS